MVFSAFQMIIGGQEATEEDLKQIVKKQITYFEGERNTYEFSLYYDETKLALLIYAKYGNTGKYSDKVLVKSGRDDFTPEKNPRSPRQIELPDQLFGYYLLKKNMLFISSIHKKKVLCKYLSEILQISVVIKNIYRSIDEFVKNVKYIKEARFVHKDTLAGRESEVFNAIANIYGLGMPNRVQVKVGYQDTPVGEVLEGIKKLKVGNDKGVTEEIILIGLNDDNIEQSFDLSTVIQRVEIDVKRDEYGQADVEETWLKLRSKLNDVYKT